MPQNVLEFLERNNANMVRLLERNPDISAFILAFVDHCVDYANRKGCAVDDVKVDRPYIDGVGSGEGEYLKARITHYR